MKSNILTKETLDRIIREIHDHDGSVNVRKLRRNNGICFSIIQEAVDHGYIYLETVKSSVGRPSIVAKKVNNTYPTKPPPEASDIGHSIKIKHWLFAHKYVIGTFNSNDVFSWKRSAWIAYKKVYKSCKTQASARSGASRLLKRPDIRAAIQWRHATLNGEINTEEYSPWTETEIWNTLYELGSFRAKWAPWWIKNQWEE